MCTPNPKLLKSWKHTFQYELYFHQFQGQSNNNFLFLLRVIITFLLLFIIGSIILFLSSSWTVGSVLYINLNRMKPWCQNHGTEIVKIWPLNKSMNLRHRKLTH